MGGWEGRKKGREEGKEEEGEGGGREGGKGKEREFIYNLIYSTLLPVDIIIHCTDVLISTIGDIN